MLFDDSHAVPFQTGGATWLRIVLRWTHKEARPLKAQAPWSRLLPPRYTGRPERASAPSRVGWPRRSRPRRVVCEPPVYAPGHTPRLPHTGRATRPGFRLGQALDVMHDGSGADSWHCRPPRPWRTFDDMGGRDRCGEYQMCSACPAHTCGPARFATVRLCPTPPPTRCPDSSWTGPPS